MADGTSFQIDLPVTGTAGVNAAAASMDTLAVRLASASAASTSAAAAVKAAEAAYAQTENSADRAAKALEKITVAADAQRGKVAEALAVGDVSGADRAGAKLQNLVARQAEAAAKASAATAAMNAEAATLDKLKSAASAAAAGEEKLKNATQAAEKAAGSGKVNEMAEGFGKLGGPLGSLGQKGFGAAAGMEKLSASLGAAGPYAAVAIAIVAIVAGIAAAGAAAIVATAHVAAWAVGLADAARTQGLLVAGVAGSVAGGAALAAAIDDISARVPATADELLGLAKPLRAAGLEGKALSDALEAAAVKAAKTKFGPDFEKQLNALPNLSARAQKNIAAIFGGLKIDSLLSGLGKMVALFDASSASGRAIKVLFESLFQPLIDATTGIIPKVIAGFIQFEIMVMKGALQMKAIWAEWGGTITLVAKAIGLVAAVAAAGLVAVLVVVAANIAIMAVGFTILVAAATAVVAGIIYLGTQMYALGAAIVGGAVASFTALTTALANAMTWLEGVSLEQLGADIIAGLAKGITAGATAVVGAVTGAVGGAVTSAKAALGIASPSKVFAEIGMNTAAGMASGVEGATGDVQGSLEAMVAPPEAGGAGGGAASAGGGGGNYAGAVFNFYGVQGAEDAVERFLALIEGDAAQLGAAVPA